MLSTLRKDDCGCGGGKYNCISKKAMQKWVIAELKRLDCGCGWEKRPSRRSMVVLLEVKS
jgi:hypothetical protein